MLQLCIVFNSVNQTVLDFSPDGATKRLLVVKQRKQERSRERDHRNGLERSAEWRSRSAHIALTAYEEFLL